jgi:hypothetical protein
VLTGGHYFRSIYVAVAISPSPVLQSWYRYALRSPKIRNDRMVPGRDRDRHLSLYHVADEEMHTRERFLQELEREEVVKPSADGLSVNLQCAPDGSDGDGIKDGESDGWLEGCTCTQI